MAAQLVELKELEEEELSSNQSVRESVRMNGRDYPTNVSMCVFQSSRYGPTTKTDQPSAE